MKGYNRIISAMVLLAVAGSSLLSCTKENTKKGATPIKISVNVSKTKGAVTTTSSLESSGAFTMDAYIDGSYYNPNDGTADNYPEKGLYINGHSTGGNVYLNSGSWVLGNDSSNKPYCWVDEVTTRFWAWHPVTAAGRTITGPAAADGKTFVFDYTTPTTSGTTDADKAIDLLFSYAENTYVEGGNDKISLTFHHALSQVRFCISTDDGTFDAKSLGIKNITLTDLKTSGTGTFDASDNSFAWSSQSGEADFGQNYNASFNKTTVTGWTKGSYTKSNKTYDLYTCENVFFMIPQDITATNMISVTFTYDGEDVTKTVPLTGNTGDPWLGEHYYTYKLKATIVGRNIEFGVNLVGWSDRDDKLFI